MALPAGAAGKSGSGVENKVPDSVSLAPA
jgi:hypothetical protein